MSKWFEVKVVAVTVYAVEVKDDETEDDAMRYAMEETHGGDRTAECGPPLTGARIDSVKRHADEILSI